MQEELGVRVLNHSRRRGLQFPRRALWFLEDAIDIDVDAIPDGSQFDDLVSLIRLDESFLHCNPTTTISDILPVSETVESVFSKLWDRIESDYGALYRTDLPKALKMAEHSPCYLKTIFSVFRLLDVLNQVNTREFLGGAWVMAQDTIGSRISMEIKFPVADNSLRNAINLASTRKGVALRIPMAKDETVEVTQFWEEVLVSFTKGFTVPLRETVLVELKGEDWFSPPYENELELFEFRKIFMEIFDKYFPEKTVFRTEKMKKKSSPFLFIYWFLWFLFFVKTVQFLR